MDPIANIFGAWSAELNIYSFILRVTLTLFLSATIGWERSIKRHQAGLRTFMLVALAATVLSILELEYGNDNFHSLTAALIIAIAIISAKSLFTSSRNQIRGLTTAVGLWNCGVVGLCIGAGSYTLGLLAYVAMLTCLFIFPKLEKYFKDRSNHFEVHLELTNPLYLQNFVTTIRELGLEIDDIEFNPAYINSGLSVYSVAITINNNLLKEYKSHKDIIEALNTLEYVNHIEEIQ